MFMIMKRFRDDFAEFDFLFYLCNVNETGWSVCRSLLGCCAPAVCRSGFARWCSCVLLFSGAFVRCVCGLMVVLRLGLLLLCSCLGSLLCFLPPLSCLRGLWWLVSLQGSPGSCHVMLCCTCIPSPCFRGLGVCVDLLKRSKTCTFFGSRGARPPVMTLPNKASHWRGSEDWSPSCTCRTCPWWWNSVVVTFLFLSLESCCFEFTWNIHYHELGTERAISLIQVCVKHRNLWEVISFHRGGETHLSLTRKKVGQLSKPPLRSERLWTNRSWTPFQLIPMPRWPESNPLRGQQSLTWCFDPWSIPWSHGRSHGHGNWSFCKNSRIFTVQKKCRDDIPSPGFPNDFPPNFSPPFPLSDLFQNLRVSTKMPHLRRK